MYENKFDEINWNDTSKEVEDNRTFERELSGASKHKDK